MKKGVDRVINARGDRDMRLGELEKMKYDPRTDRLATKQYNSLFAVFHDLCHQEKYDVAFRVVFPILRDCLKKDSIVNSKHITWLATQLESFSGDENRLSCIAELLETLMRRAKQSDVIADACVKPVLSSMWKIHHSQSIACAMIGPLRAILEDILHCPQETQLHESVAKTLLDNIEQAATLFAQADYELQFHLLEIMYLIVALHTDRDAFDQDVSSIAKIIDPQRTDKVIQNLYSIMFEDSDVPVAERARKFLAALHNDNKTTISVEGTSMVFKRNSKETQVDTARVHLCQTCMFLEGPNCSGKIGFLRVLYRDVERVTFSKLKKGGVELTIHGVLRTSFVSSTNTDSYSGPVKIVFADSSKQDELSHVLSARMRRAHAAVPPVPIVETPKAKERASSVNSRAFQLLPEKEKQRLEESLDDIQDFSQEVERLSHANRRPSLVLKPKSAVMQPDRKQDTKMNAKAITPEQERVPSPFDFEAQDSPMLAQRDSVTRDSDSETTAAQQSRRRSQRLAKDKAKKVAKQTKRKRGKNDTTKAEPAAKKSRKSSKKKVESTNESVELEDDFDAMYIESSPPANKNSKNGNLFRMPSFSFKPMSPVAFAEHATQPEPEEFVFTSSPAVPARSAIMPVDNFAMTHKTTAPLLAPETRNVTGDEQAVLDRVRVLREELQRSEAKLAEFKQQRVLAIHQQYSEASATSLHEQLHVVQTTANQHANEYKNIALELLQELDNQSKSHLAFQQSMVQQLDHLRGNLQNTMRKTGTALQALSKNSKMYKMFVNVLSNMSEQSQQIQTLVMQYRGAASP